MKGKKGEPDFSDLFDEEQGNPEEPLDPVHDGILRSDGDLSELIATVVRSTRFAKIYTIEDEYPLDVEMFLILRALVALDLFAGNLPDGQKKVRIPNIGSRAPHNLRKNVYYERVKEEMSDQFRAISGAQSMVETAGSMEGLFVEKTLSQALLGAGRDKMNAIRDFTERISAKKGRDDGNVTLRLPSDLVELIRQANETSKIGEREIRKIGSGSTKELEVGADRLNVPALHDGEGGGENDSST